VGKKVSEDVPLKDVPLKDVLLKDVLLKDVKLTLQSFNSIFYITLFSNIKFILHSSS
jgi:hypothetical protein